MIVLTKEQHEALAGATGDSVRVIDPITNIEYLLLPADVVARLRGLDADFEKATERVFKEHEDLLRRLA